MSQELRKILEGKFGDIFAKSKKLLLDIYKVSERGVGFGYSIKWGDENNVIDYLVENKLIEAKYIGYTGASGNSISQYSCSLTDSGRELAKKLETEENLKLRLSST